MSSEKRGKNRLKGFYKYRVGSKETTLAIEEYYAALDCPRSLALWLMFSNNEHDQMVNVTWDPLAYDTLQASRDSYMATKFLSKYEGLNLHLDKDEEAWKKFDKFELLCKSTNDRFRHLASDPLYQGAAVWIHNESTRKIAELLGDFNPAEFASSPDWGPGASTKVKRRDASATEKFQNESGITRDLYSLVSPELMGQMYPHWSQHLVTGGVYPPPKSGGTYPCYEVGNKVITVAKDAKSNRVIAIEPGINLWFQKSIGEMVRSRLRRVGINLNSQKRNQLLAKKGSLTGDLATVDMESASDSVSTSVVRELLPPDWFTIMDTCRSHYGHLRGQVHKWAKFSSMGNGFTFELESLIFYAVAKSCVEYLRVTGDKTVSVYGDDVILPTSAFKMFSEMMTFYGFRINERKSHTSGFFRESCGDHYFSGFDLKPIYLKGRLSSILTVYRLANAVRRLAHRQCNYMACDARFRPMFDLLVQRTPKALRLRVPEGLGDGGFIGNFDEATPTSAYLKPKSLYVEGYEVQQLGEVAECYESEQNGYLLAELWRISDREPASLPFRKRLSRLESLRRLITWNDVEFQGRNSVPRHQTKMRLSMSLVRQWYDLGPWA